MEHRSRIDEVLRDLSQRGIECGLATLPGGRVRTWIDVDGILIEGDDFEATHEASDKIAQWLQETAEAVFGRLPDNVVDARARFMKGRVSPPPKEAFPP